MNKKFLLTAIMLMLMPSLAHAEESVFKFGAFGNVHVYKDSPNPKNIVLFISGDGGWNLGVVDMARTLMKNDSLVAGVDITAYLKNAGNSKGSCMYSAADFEALSQYIQTKFKYKTYTPPIIVGYSSGATLAYNLLAQAPANTFSGGVSLGFCPDLTSSKPMCKGANLTYVKDKKHPNTYLYDRVDELSSPWVALQGLKDQVCDPPQTDKFVSGMKNGEVIDLPKVGHGFSVEKNWMPQFKEAFAKIVEKNKKKAENDVKPQSLSDLPVIEQKVTSAKGGVLTIIASGDGGWAGIDRDIAKAMNSSGINVVGLNTLQYFWEEKTPDQAAKDLSRIISYYSNEFKPSKIILVGYSFGADVLPFMYNRLPAEQKKTINTLALLGVDDTTSFIFRVSEWVYEGSSDKQWKVLPEAKKIDATDRVCFYGEDEKDDTICPALEKSGFKIIKTKGGHHFGGDYKALSDNILLSSKK